MNDVMALQRLFILKKRGLLTADHILAAKAFRHRASEMDLPKAVHALLSAILLQGKGLETLEKENGWPARSAKALLAFSLDIVLESQDVSEVADKAATPAANFLAAACADNDLLEIMTRMGLTATEARIHEILRRDTKGFVTREELLCRLYADQDEDAPGDKTIDVIICNLRRKLHPFGYQIHGIKSGGFVLKTPAYFRAKCYQTKNPASEDDANMVDYMTATPAEAAIIGTMERYGLTKTEARVLNAMVAAPNRQISRDHLMSQVYPNTTDRPNEKTIDVYIYKLRKKLKPHGMGIRVIWSWGWELIIESEKADTAA